MNQSHTNEPRSEVISWTSFLTHSSSERQVLYVLVSVLQCCSDGCASITEMQQTPGPAGRQEQECHPLSAAVPAFLLLPLLILCFAICKGREISKGFSESSVQTFSSSVQTWRKIHRLHPHHSGVWGLMMLKDFSGQGPQEVTLYLCVSPFSVPLSQSWAS